MKTIKANVQDVIFTKMKKKKAEDGFPNESWEKWFAHLVENENVSDTEEDSISKSTCKNLEPLWMQNLARNLPYIIKDGKSVRELIDKEKGKSAIIVGAGPSIYNNKHLEQLKNSDFKGVVVATDKMLIPCLERQIIPNYVLSLDAHPKFVPAFYDHPQVKENARKIKAILGIYVSPNLTKLLRKIKMDTYWFTVTAEKNIVLLTVSERNPNGIAGIRCCGNTGTASWVLSWAILKCNPTCVIGFDFGYPEGTNLEDTPYYSGVLRISPVKSEAALLGSPIYKTIYHPIFKSKAMTDSVFRSYRNHFLNAIACELPSAIKVYNCTEGGTLFGEGIECVPFKEFLKLV